MPRLTHYRQCTHRTAPELCCGIESCARLTPVRLRPSILNLRKAVRIDFQRFAKKNSGGNAGLMESVEGRTMKPSSLPLFPQPLEIATAAIPTFPPHGYGGM